MMVYGPGLRRIIERFVPFGFKGKARHILKMTALLQKCPREYANEKSAEQAQRRHTVLLYSADEMQCFLNHKLSR